MPHVPQEPLTRLYVKASALIMPTWQPPPWTLATIGQQSCFLEKSMNLDGADSWEATGPTPVDDFRGYMGFYYWVTYNLTFTVRIIVDWYADQIDLDVLIHTGGSSYWTRNHMRRVIAGCERGNPWYLPPTTLNPVEGIGTASVTAWRPVPGTLISAIPPPFQPNSTLSLWSGSFLAKGPFNNRVITYKPTYPPGAIPGTTPPTGRGAILRKKATGKIYTDYGHVRQNAAFTFAAETWAALTNAERAAWQRAGKTCKPPLHGYTLWTQLTKTKRLDRIPALEARIGETLAKPPLFP